MSDYIMGKISILAMALFMIQLAAASSISITSVSIPSSINQGASFSITAYIEGDSVQDTQSSLSLPSGISCTPTSAQSVSLSNTTSGSGSSSWSCTGDVSGDYSNQITVAAQGTPTTGGSATSASLQTGLNVLAPASIVSSSSISASTVVAGSTRILTVSANNAGDVSTTIAITPSTSGGAFSPTSYSALTLEGNSIVTKTFTFTAGSTAGAYTITSTVTSTDAGTSTSTASISITASATPTASATATTQDTQGNVANTPPPVVTPPVRRPSPTPSPSPTPKPSPTKAIVAITDTPTPTAIPYKGEYEGQLAAAITEIGTTKANGLDVAEAEQLVATAKDYASKGNYELALSTARLAREKLAAILDAASKPLPEDLQLVTKGGSFNWLLIALIVVVVIVGVYSYVKFAEKQRHHFREHHPPQAEQTVEETPKAEKKGKHKGELDII